MGILYRRIQMFSEGLVFVLMGVGVGGLRLAIRTEKRAREGENGRESLKAQS
jgi:hypothetical protein